MTEGSLPEIFRALGTLTNEVKNLGQKIDKAEEKAGEDNRRAEQHRATMHRRVDELVDEVGDMKTSVAVLTKDVAAAKAVTDDVVKLGNQAQGAGTAGRVLIKVGIGIVGAVGYAVGLYSWLTGRPPP